MVKKFKFKERKFTTISYTVLEYIILLKIHSVIDIFNVIIWLCAILWKGYDLKKNIHITYLHI